MPTSNSLTRDESGVRRAGSLADGFPSNVCSCPASLAVPAIRASVAHPRPREGVPAAADLERQPERVEDVALGVSQGAEAGAWVEDHAVADHLPFALLIPTNLPVHVRYLLAESHAVAVESVLPCRRRPQSDGEPNEGDAVLKEDAARPGSHHGNRLRRAAATWGMKKTQLGPGSHHREWTQEELL